MKNKVTIEVVTGLPVDTIHTHFARLCVGAERSTITVEAADGALEETLKPSKRREDKSYGDDPRVVWRDPGNPYSAIDVEATLAKIGLDRDALCARSWPRGSLENAVKRSIANGARDARPEPAGELLAGA